MNLENLTIKKTRELLKSKEIKSSEIVEEIYKNIESDNNTDQPVNAYVELFKDEAIKKAKETDDKISHGEYKPLLGVPIAIKDNLAYTGHEMSASSRMLKGYIAPYTATAVERLINNGAIILGRTNMDEYAMGGTTETSRFGITRNPHDRNKVPGGSSGGSAASTAANQNVASLGSDTGGSIRQPASFCGVVGMKPTYGRVPRYGCIAMGSSLDQIGPITKNVYDAALMISIMAGYDQKDSTSSKKDVPYYEGNLEKDIKGLKIGLPKEYFNTSVLDDDVRTNIEKSIKNLESNGAEIIEVSLPHSKYGSAVYTAIMSVEVASNMGRFDGIRYGYHPEGEFNLDEYYYTSRGDSFGFETRARILFGTLLTGAQYFHSHYEHALKVRRLIQNDFIEAYQNCDVLISPSTPTTASLLGNLDNTDSELNYLADCYTSLLNVAGVPAISVPAGLDKNNMPIGLQVIGNFFDEDTILRVAHHHEMYSTL